MKFLIGGFLAALVLSAFSGRGLRRFGWAIDSFVRGFARVVLGLLCAVLAARAEIFGAWATAVFYAIGGILIGIGVLQLTGWIGTGRDEN